MSHIYDIILHEKPEGVIVQLGGQTALKLAEKLERYGIKIFGTSYKALDLAEDRKRFSELLVDLDIPFPSYGTATTADEASAIADKLDFPILVRPSYVLGGQGMKIVINKEDSSIYCYSAVFNNKLNDDVYNYKGKIIYSNRMHIEHSSNTIHVMKSFEKNGIYFIENSLTNEKYQLAGERFYYLKNNIAFFINNDHWFTIDLTNKKKQKIDKASYFFTLFYFFLISINPLMCYTHFYK